MHKRIKSQVINILLRMDSPHRFFVFWLLLSIIGAFTAGEIVIGGLYSEGTDVHDWLIFGLDFFVMWLLVSGAFYSAELRFWSIPRLLMNPESLDVEKIKAMHIEWIDNITAFLYLIAFCILINISMTLY